MMNHNDIVTYKNKINNTKEKLIECTLKNTLPQYFNFITDEKINVSIKNSIQCNSNYITFYIDAERKTFTNGYSLYENVKKYYNEYKNEFKELNIEHILNHIKESFCTDSEKIMKYILSMDCTKEFISKFQHEGYKVTSKFDDTFGIIIEIEF